VVQLRTSSIRLYFHKLSSPNKDKILNFKRRIEELHSDKQFYKELEDINKESEELKSKLDGILKGLEEIWVKFKNEIPLKGWCETGVEGK